MDSYTFRTEKSFDVAYLTGEKREIPGEIRMLVSDVDNILLVPIFKLLPYMSGKRIGHEIHGT